MKTTGVIRRIDDLGRVVIPKEVRKNLKIKNGENVEIFIDNEDIVLKKYSPLENLDSVTENYVEAMYHTIRRNIIITDRDKVIATGSNIKNKYKGNDISPFVERLIERRDNLVEYKKVKVNFINGVEEFCSYSCSPIIGDGDCIGYVIIFSNDSPLLEIEEKMTIMLSKLLGKYFME